MKTISIKNPWSYLICSGLKNIENRTWPTKFRGRVLIHASANPVKNTPNPLNIEQWNSLSPDQKLLIRSNTLPNSAIIGSVEIVDCVINHPSIWAEKSEGVIAGNTFYHKESDNVIWNLVLSNPIMFPEPIPAKGKLSFWDYPNILAEPEEKDGELFCHCQLPVNEKVQVSGDSRFGYYCRYCGGKWYK